MPILMTGAQKTNYILSYESAVEALRDKPGDRNLQHKAVLSLARSGALDFAIAEFDRFGLNQSADNEDIMALSGRLSKDLYLRNSGAKALSHAKQAAEKYEAAFRETQGYYSGINSATMALMAEMPPNVIADRVEAVESLLPCPENLTPEDHYFIEATRAECFLLNGNQIDARKSLESAINFDPLNFGAHATTLKQFKMIANKRSESLDWLKAFNPPRPIHFAGRIRIEVSEKDLENLKISISDAVQKSDIGYGYGALAAGYDIIIAEILLEEGAELHVVLPCSKDAFIDASVKPYGKQWVTRFKSCLKRADSVRILNSDTPWPDKVINRLNGQVAMGQAILAARSLEVLPLQLLILGENSGGSFTVQHAFDWTQTGFQKIIVPNMTVSSKSAKACDKIHHFRSILQCSDDKTIQYFNNIEDAIVATDDIRTKNPKTKIALHIEIPGVEEDQTIQNILDHSTPQSVLLSEVFASLLAVSAGDSFEISYAGAIEPATGAPLRCYSFTKN